MVVTATNVVTMTNDQGEETMSDQPVGVVTLTATGEVEDPQRRSPLLQSQMCLGLV